MVNKTKETVNEDKIERSIVPIKAADLIEYIAQRKGMSVMNAMCRFYDSELSAKLYDNNAKWWYLDNETLYKLMEQERRLRDGDMDSKELQFVVFCVESYARRNNLSGLQTYSLFKAKNLISFLKNNFEVLHTQGEDYIMDEIRLYLKRRNKTLA